MPTFPHSELCTAGHTFIKHISSVNRHSTGTVTTVLNTLTSSLPYAGAVFTKSVTVCHVGVPLLQCDSVRYFSKLHC